MRYTRVERAGSDDRVVPLDGLRGLALLLVLVHNVGTVQGGLDGLPIKLLALVVNAGWVGVTIFFALSGYLITRILLESRGSSGYFFRFYARRALRIFPVAYATLALTFVVAPHVGVLAPIATAPERTALWYWSYASNWIAPFGGDAPPLAHFWSLAVEEQFYLVWPLVIAALAPKSVGRFCLAAAFIALASRLLLLLSLPGAAGESAAYSFTFARWDGLALGAAVAVAATTGNAARVKRWTSLTIVGAAGALVLLVGMNGGLSPHGLATETIGQSLVALLSASLVAVCISDDDSRPQALLRRMLSARWLISLGTYSYAMYLFHPLLHRILQPIFLAPKSSGSSITRAAWDLGYVAIVLLCTYGLARISWVVLEEPLLRLKRFFPRRTVREAGMRSVEAVA